VLQLLFSYFFFFFGVSCVLPKSNCYWLYIYLFFFTISLVSFLVCLCFLIIDNSFVHFTCKIWCVLVYKVVLFFVFICFCKWVFIPLLFPYVIYMLLAFLIT
jgi:hypothetical protein